MKPLVKLCHTCPNLNKYNQKSCVDVLKVIHGRVVDPWCVGDVLKVIHSLVVDPWCVWAGGGQLAYSFCNIGSSRKML
jgi:hypothetical protein